MKEQSPLQKVCMQYGKDCFAMGNTWTLIRFLKANDQHVTALQVEAALSRAKSIARANYFARRKELQPDWKDWKEQMDEAMAEVQPWSIA
jgi:hypothetical protein